MKSKMVRLSQLQRINDKYKLNAKLFNRGTISFERLLKWQAINKKVQVEIKKIDQSFGTPLAWQHIVNGAVS